MIYEKFDFEKKRKLFHLSSLIFPIVYINCAKISIILILFPIASITTYLDITRHYNPKLKFILNNLFINIMRNDEVSGSFKLSGVTYMMSGFLCSAVLFSKQLTITSWFILIFSDAIASLVGSKIGKIRINEKTFEGSLAFFISAVFISINCYFYIGYTTNFVNIIISCLATTLIELYSKEININDNLSIPMSYCLVSSFLNINW